MAKKRYYIIAIVTLTLLTTFLHFTTMGKFSPYVVLEELFYIPLLLGVLRFGHRGAIGTWLFVSAAYLPFFFPLGRRVFQNMWTGVFTSSCQRWLPLSSDFFPCVNVEIARGTNVSGILPASVGLPPSSFMI